MTRLTLTAPVALLLLGACQTPLQLCLAEAAAPAADLREELAERRASLTRGYRLERESVPVMVFSQCYLPGTPPGAGTVYPCTEWVNEERSRRVPIDPQVEAERIALIERQLARAEAQEGRALAACRAAHPEG